MLRQMRLSSAEREREVCFFVCVRVKCILEILGKLSLDTGVKNKTFNVCKQRDTYTGHVPSLLKDLHLQSRNI